MMIFVRCETSESLLIERICSFRIFFFLWLLLLVDWNKQVINDNDDNDIIDLCPSLAKLT